jgi:hypothetical protein
MEGSYLYYQSIMPTLHYNKVIVCVYIHMFDIQFLVLCAHFNRFRLFYTQEIFKPNKQLTGRVLQKLHQIQIPMRNPYLIYTELNKIKSFNLCFMIIFPICLLNLKK